MERTRPSRASASRPVLYNVFFALWPSADVRGSIERAARRLEQDHRPRGRWIRPERLHMTLCFLGAHERVPDDLLASAFAAGDGVRVGAFRFALDVAASFANRRIPWWLGCREVAPALAGLAEILTRNLRIMNAPVRAEEPFVPHVTILRDADAVLTPTSIEPIDWPVGEFALIESIHDAQPRYVTLQRWPLSH